MQWIDYEKTKLRRGTKEFVGLRVEKVEIPKFKSHEYRGSSHGLARARLHHEAESGIFKLNGLELAIG